MSVRWLAALLLVVQVPSVVRAQDVERPEVPRPTAQVIDSIAADSASVPEEGRQAARRKSPGTAVLLSALLPGGGQVYTGGYWRAALIAPAEVALGYFSVREHLDATRALKEGEENEYVLHRDRRTTFLWWTGAVIAFSMADAYISAQLYDFDEQMRFSRTTDGRALAAVAARMSLKLGFAKAGIEFGL